VKPPKIEMIDGIWVVRDDLITGGTKARIITEILKAEFKRQQKNRLTHLNQEFVYASPVYGYAQIAIAVGCAKMGFKSTVFVAQRKQLHPRTEEAREMGAKIIEVPMGFLSNCAAKAKSYCLQNNAVLLPFGLDCPELIKGMIQVGKEIKVSPKQVWCVAGSGTLTRALQAVWPNAEHHVVRVGKRDSDIGQAKEYPETSLALYMPK
jgi:threonine dehydratase